MNLQIVCRKLRLLRLSKPGQRISLLLLQPVAVVVKLVIAFDGIVRHLRELRVG